MTLDSHCSRIGPRLPTAPLILPPFVLLGVRLLAMNRRCPRLPRIIRNKCVMGFSAHPR